VLQPSAPPSNVLSSATETVVAADAPRSEVLVDERRNPRGY
jgi:hypothetical protein